LFVIGLILGTFGILILFLGLFYAPICVGRCSPGTPLDFSEAYSGLPFVIMGFAILIWSFLSKDGKDSSEPAQEEKIDLTTRKE
jgi:hypothetical protein